MRVVKSTLALAMGTFAATAAIAADPEYTLPAWAGIYEPSGEDERGIWRETDEIERRIRDSDLVIRDEALHGYVHGVLCRTVGEDRCRNVRTYVVRSPSFNAGMYPNGAMLVNSGLLLRLRNEAELAAILGHEFGHFEQRHTVEGFKDRRSGSDLLAWAAVLGAMASAYGGSYSQSDYRDLQLIVYGGQARYKRQQESDSDLLGFAYLARAGYRPAAAADVWRAVMNEHDRSAEGRNRRSRRYDNVAFFASHPTNLDRADYLAAMANRVPGGEYQGAQAYRDAVDPWIPMFLQDQLALNDFGGSDYVISRLSGGETPSPFLQFARAELLRQRGHPRDLEDALPLYRDALTRDPDLVEAWRGMGLTLMRKGSSDEGRSALVNFLDRSPDAPDAPMLHAMVGSGQ